MNLAKLGMFKALVVRPGRLATNVEIGDGFVLKTYAN